MNTNNLFLVTVDIVLLSEPDERILLIKRGGEPYAGNWALPGGKVHSRETLEQAARRELEEETCLQVRTLEQLHTFGNPGRDPRGRTVSVAYLAVLDRAGHGGKAASDASDLGWFPIANLPPLAFDHREIIACALRYRQAGGPAHREPACRTAGATMMAGKSITGEQAALAPRTHGAW